MAHGLTGLRVCVCVCVCLRVNSGSDVIGLTDSNFDSNVLNGRDLWFVKVC